MKVGDLVKRGDSFKEWMKHNSWMSLDEEQEIGILIEIEFPEVGAFTHVVQWPVTGLSWEDPADLEVA